MRKHNLYNYTTLLFTITIALTFFIFWSNKKREKCSSKKVKEGFTGLRTMYNKTNRGISHFTENTIITIKEHVSRFTRKIGISKIIS